MARITVSDCVQKEPNRFSLVRKAADRARRLANNEVRPLVEAGNHKPTVIALYEIAAGYDFDETESSTSDETGTEGTTDNRTILGSKTPFSSSLL